MKSNVSIVGLILGMTFSVTGIIFYGYSDASVKHVTVFISSQAGERLAKSPDLVLKRAGEGRMEQSVMVDTAIRYQKIEGFGATFNEAGMICLNSLPAENRDSVLRALFDTVNGAGYTMMKSPVAACDFASAGPWYSYNDNPGDTLMTKFTVERDLQSNGLIPYIKSAARFGKFRIESPMDFAPDWMLISLKQGEKHVRKEYYRALARYYSKYISEYLKNGVRIDFLNPFNEPENRWYSNETYKAIGIMVKNHIVPQFRADGISAHIQLCETTTRPEALQKFPASLDDPEVRKHIHSLTVHGYDWNRFSALQKLHERYPGFEIWMTEVCYAPYVGNTPENGPKTAPVYEFSDGEFWGNMIMNDMKNWVSAWIYWNMILDEKGGPWLISTTHGDPDNNGQHPVVIIDRQTKKVTYTGLYYYLAHFSRFIRPGSMRIECRSTDNQLNCTAFECRGKVILVMINNGDSRKSSVNLAGWIGDLEIQGHSIMTLEFDPRSL